MMALEVDQEDAAGVSQGNGEQMFADLLEEATRQLQRDGEVDLEALVRTHPQHADQLRELLPAMAAMASWGRSGSGVERQSSRAPSPRHGESQVTYPLPEREGFQSGVLGDFRIIQEIGRGGMGVVYEAEQISIGRRVALKVLPFAAMLDRQQLIRFKNEARAAGTLDHPNIVAIYSVGCERGVNYYSMQFIRGRSLAEVIAAMKSNRHPSAEATVPLAALSNRPTSDDTAKAAAQPTVHDQIGLAVSTIPTFDSPEYYQSIAKLGIQAAEALDYAHQNGILHRDIKPANLLVDETGKLLITDFGLARIEQDAGMTMTGDLLGTLRYMSPEQALAKRGVVDQRSDIYSLGITLYELLTLCPAVNGDDRQELLRQIAFEEPRKPRQINGRIPRDLETIVLKAIEKEPGDRYATSNDLAADLQRYVQSEPIKARPTGLVQRWVKWSRRHVAALWALAAVLLLTTLVFLGAAVQIARSSREAKRQQNTADAVSNLLQELLNSADPTAAKGSDYTVRQLLDSFAATLSDQLIDQPDVEIKLRIIVGEAYNSLGLNQQSDAQFQRALELQSTAFGSDALGLADILTSRAWTIYDLGNINKAIDCLEQARNIYRHNGGSQEQVLANLALLHTLRWNNRQVEAADEIAAEAMLIIGDVNTAEYSAVPHLLRSIGTLNLARQRIAEAETVLRQALNVEQRISRKGKAKNEFTLSNLGRALARQGKLEEAEAAHREAFTIIRAALGSEHGAFQTIARRFAIVLQANGKSSEANSVVTEIIAGYDERVRQGLMSADDCGALAWILIVCKFDALADTERAIEIATRGCELTNYKDANLLDILAAAYAAKGNYAVAAQWSKAALGLADSVNRKRLTEHLTAFENGRIWWDETAKEVISGSI
jgi:serine/threonine protein kinase